ncbi:hypothetical protein BpHYR1_030626 [Brachionus plicatilis]|uniref:Uncharacterized protein n=1 Tax=Brachionus plicatilis TaxID=10195 RepID=A0A3M7QMG7_BRAPC|nr:hypothetical protein BpHYR1_030626 [Brachionus plicatilis]
MIPTCQDICLLLAASYITKFLTCNHVIIISIFGRKKGRNIKKPPNMGYHTWGTRICKKNLESQSSDSIQSQVKSNDFEKK